MTQIKKKLNTQIVTKLLNCNCENSKTQHHTKIKHSHYVKTKKKSYSN